MIEDDIRRAIRKHINDKLDDYFDGEFDLTEFLNTPAKVAHLSGRPLEVFTADQIAVMLAERATDWMSDEFHEQSMKDLQTEADNRSKQA